MTRVREVTVVRHAEDYDHYWTGHEGQWTVCAQPWANQADGEVDCPECVKLWQVRLLAEAGTRRRRRLRVV